jgi:hypothetical protein
MRYRPTLLRTPSEANLRQARQQLAGIRARINNGTFSFAEAFLAPGAPNRRENITVATADELGWGAESQMCQDGSVEEACGARASSGSGSWPGPPSGGSMHV